VAPLSDTEARATLEEIAKGIASLVRPLCPEGVVFMTVVADVGPDGSFAYASNVDRGDMIRLLAEVRAKLIEARQ